MRLGYELKFPDLERLHLYNSINIGDPSSTTEDHAEYATVWSRYMPKLREVVLHRKIMWTKTGPRNQDWTSAVVDLTSADCNECEFIIAASLFIKSSDGCFTI